MRSLTGWCGAGDHRRCRRAFYMIVNPTQFRMCGCSRDGCPCAVMNHHFPEPEELPQTDVQVDEEMVQ